MKCPACISSLKSKPYESVVVDECEVCRSVWIASDALAGVIKSTEKSFTAEEAKAVFLSLKQTSQQVRNLSCPRCSAVLQSHHYAADMDLHIDRCPNDHGVFLDNSELEAIQLKFEDRSAAGSSPIKKAHRGSSSAATKKCPRDGSELNTVSYERESVDLCPKCGGVWCDANELGSIIKSRDLHHGDALFPEYNGNESSANWQAADSFSHVTPCVICSAPMAHLNYCLNSGIMIDTCKHGHGTWLDRSELVRVQIFAERWGKNIDATYARHAHKLAVIAAQTAADYDLADKQRKRQARSLSVVGRILNSIFKS
jgi:Zn-finger nucleic acid-binding protein